MDLRFLDSWLICGPFFSDRGWATLDEDYIFGEARVRPRAGTRSFGCEWLEYDTTDGFLQFLHAPFEHTLFCAAYAHTYVYAPADMTVNMLCGSDDGIKVWLNGELVWRNDVNRSCVPGEDRVQIDLKAGWNSLLIKVRQGMAHWQFCMQFADDSGRDISGLKWAREADLSESAPDCEYGVRARFTSETYTARGDSIYRWVQFEVGNTGSRRLDDIVLSIDGAADVPVGSLEPGEARLLDVELPFEAVQALMQHRVKVTASNAEIHSQVTLSELGRLLRDFFAPVFVPRNEDGACAANLPPIFNELPKNEFARDERGTYILVDPPGLRDMLAKFVARFPMDKVSAGRSHVHCCLLLSSALSGDSARFEAELKSAQILLAEVAK